MYILPLLTIAYYNFDTWIRIDSKHRKNGDKIRFIKRDEDVDSVLQEIADDEEIRLSLLEYNDFRIANDAKEKILLFSKLADGWKKEKLHIRT